MCFNVTIWILIGIAYGPRFIKHMMDFRVQMTDSEMLHVSFKNRVLYATLDQLRTNEDRRI